ncbi:hypothetical protein BDZ91DRAFT_841516 [Kalaharituber pfeilii]|nr:hypothetical protein BDZ91DRAFT_841516 [Kalaharituber pfeilii]
MPSSIVKKTTTVPKMTLTAASFRPRRTNAKYNTAAARNSTPAAAAGRASKRSRTPEQQAVEDDLLDCIVVSQEIRPVTPLEQQYINGAATGLRPVQSPALVAQGVRQSAPPAQGAKRKYSAPEEVPARKKNCRYNLRSLGPVKEEEQSPEPVVETRAATPEAETRPVTPELWVWPAISESEAEIANWESFTYTPPWMEEGEERAATPGVETRGVTPEVEPTPAMPEIWVWPPTSDSEAEAAEYSESPADTPRPSQSVPAAPHQVRMSTMARKTGRLLRISLSRITTPAAPRASVQESIDTESSVKANVDQEDYDASSSELAVVESTDSVAASTLSGSTGSVASGRWLPAPLHPPSVSAPPRALRSSSAETWTPLRPRTLHPHHIKRLPSPRSNTRHENSPSFLTEHAHDTLNLSATPSRIPDIDATDGVMTFHLVDTRGWEVLTSATRLTREKRWELLMAKWAIEEKDRLWDALEKDDREVLEGKAEGRWRELYPEEKHRFWLERVMGVSWSERPEPGSDSDPDSGSDKENMAPPATGGSDKENIAPPATGGSDKENIAPPRTVEATPPLSTGPRIPFAPYEVSPDEDHLSSPNQTPSPRPGRLAPVYCRAAYRVPYFDAENRCGMPPEWDTGYILSGSDDSPGEMYVGLGREAPTDEEEYESREEMEELPHSSAAQPGHLLYLTAAMNSEITSTFACCIIDNPLSIGFTRVTLIQKLSIYPTVTTHILYRGMPADSESQEIRWALVVEMG